MAKPMSQFPKWNPNTYAPVSKKMNPDIGPDLPSWVSLIVQQNQQNNAWSSSSSSSSSGNNGNLSFEWQWALMEVKGKVKVKWKDGKKTEMINLRKAGGKLWEDKTLDEWPENDFRIFCGDLGKLIILLNST